MSANQSPASRWGRARFGGPGVLLLLSLAGGMLISGGFGVLGGMMVAPDDRMLLAGALFAVMTLPATVALVWAMLVDRSTLRGATSDPESSIEGRWYDKAAAAVFTDLLLVCGLGATVFAFTGLQAPINLVLVAVLVVGMADFGARYLSLKRAEG